MTGRQGSITQGQHEYIENSWLSSVVGKSAQFTRYKLFFDLLIIYIYPMIGELRVQNQCSRYLLQLIPINSSPTSNPHNSTLPLLWECNMHTLPVINLGPLALYNFTIPYHLNRSVHILANGCLRRCLHTQPKLGSLFAVLALSAHCWVQDAPSTQWRCCTAWAG